MSSGDVLYQCLGAVESRTPILDNISFNQTLKGYTHHHVIKMVSNSLSIVFFAKEKKGSIYSAWSFMVSVHC